MTDNEFRISSMFGSSALVVYLSLKKNKRLSNSKIQQLTGLSDNTIKKGIKCLKETKIITEQGNKYASQRELIINPESDWILQ